jgi:hypothetical protein
MKRKLVPAIAAAAAVALTAAADSMWEIVPPVPFPVDTAGSAWQTQNLESLYQTGGGFSSVGREDGQPAATEPTQGSTAFRLESASWGFGISEMQADFNLGEYCTDFPDGEIDWDATETAITNSAAYKDGFVFFVDSATEDSKRVLFTRGGDVVVPWKLVGGEDSTRTYTVGQTTTARPYRIFWTELPFNGPKIDLTAHQHVRLLGDPSIVQPVYESTLTSGQTGVSNIVRGVVYDATAKALRCYCRVIDEETRQYDGPEGQFVLAYFDSGSKDNLVATIVVEACSPDVTVIPANVGDELRPAGGGYDIDGLESQIAQGDMDVTGDKAAPYLYRHKGKTNWSPKDGAVFAISPTDATTTKTGESAPWRADIYWMAPDPLDTLWPFEEDWYEISWPSNAPAFIVSGDAGNPGLPIIAPTNYTTAVCDYQSPANIATAGNNGCVSATEPGMFTLKITADDNIWFQPVKAVLCTDPAYSLTNAAQWTVGSEITLLGGAAARNTEAAAMMAEGTLPGYIYAPRSDSSHNWNPRLYHEPKQDSASDVSDANSDPYESLYSAIYPVNVAPTPIEVWWSCAVWQEGMEGVVKMPCVVQRYAPEWPRLKDVQNIVIASQRGSDGLIAGSSASALYLNAESDHARTTEYEGVGAGRTGGLTFGFWVNPSPGGAGYPEATDGLLVTLCKDDEPGAVAFRLGFAGGAASVKLSTTANSGGSWTDLVSVSVPTDDWTFVSLAMKPTMGVSREASFVVGAQEAWSGTLSVPVVAEAESFDFCIGAWSPLAGGNIRPSATGVAIDSVSVWSSPLTAEQIAELWEKVDGSATADIALQRRYSFDEETDLVAIPGMSTRFAFDSVGYRRLLSNGPLKMSPGAPKLYSGLVSAEGSVAPEIYYENDDAKMGFNPNDEHAFLAEGPSGWIVHALRCDLASDSGSQPFVLVQYEKEGKGAMRVYGVVLTNSVYSTLGSERTAGLMFTPPHPLETLDYANNAKNYARTVSASPTNSFGEVTTDSEVVYYDRHSRMWGRRDGEANAYYYYAVQNGFWFPDTDPQPAVGTLVPWLSRVVTNTADVITSAPMPWRWSVVWPDDETVPTMRVAQTLTKASSGLPEVWSASSMAVAFPAPDDNKVSREGVVHLIDPTVAQERPLKVESSFPNEYGFTLGPAGTTQLKGSKYYFTGLPPSISDRFYVDAANQKMVLVGKLVEKSSGGSYLQLNVLTPEERAALRGICKGPEAARTVWTAAVNALAVAEVQPNKTARKEIATPSAGKVVNVVTTYSPVDHYALVASGEGTGYVTLIENDSPDTTMVDEGATVSMHVIKVVPELYAGGLTVITDPMNKLSEQLTISYTSPFGAAADDFEFEWRRVETPADGSVPTNYPGWRMYGGSADPGRVSILLGAEGADLKDLQNMYYAMRYRAKDGTTAHAVTGDEWSGWCGPTLAEGWVQRVLNSVTPFAQRCMDFSTYTADLSYSMLEQIGAPYQGDVALNNDNLNNIGLLELYRTVLNKAENMSLKLGAKTDAGVNKQLLLAASRIAELYGILGDEAYADAKNPTIGQMFAGSVYDADSLSSSVFCFQNQLPTLIDEELALLRGRTSAVAPNMKTHPYYNRLIWNFTKGITEGEIAYVNNYMIRGSDGEITQEQAAKQYPQGHGDAYGHYLSMVKSFYHLVRNPYFDWYASMTEMLIGDSIVNVDYFDEDKFAAAAGNLARTALDTMDLTARKAWKDAEGVVGAGYFDADAEQAFGYGEWATRAGYGALCNWAVVNSLLPTNGTPVNAVFEDKGVKRIDRSTARSLCYLPSVVRDIQTKLDALDAGMNPLGFSDNAIPFDMEPTEINGDTATAIPHFEQMLARTEKALENAQTVLTFAQEFGSRLAQISLEETEAVGDHLKTEAEFDKNLIAIYGTPLAGDIGPGGTYAQGYSGPDLYHYMYVDLAPYGLKAVESKLDRQIVTYKVSGDTPSYTAEGLNYETDGTVSIVYTLTPDGIPQAPAAKGVRETEGTIQTAYRAFLAAYVKLRQASTTYNKAVGNLKIKSDIAKTQLSHAHNEYAFNETMNAVTIFKAGVDLTTGRIAEAMDLTKDLITDAEDFTVKAVPKIVGLGMTVNTDPSAIVGGVAGLAAKSGKAGAMTAGYAAKSTAAAVDFWKTTLETVFKGITDKYDFYDAQVESWERLKSATGDVFDAAKDLQEAYGDLAAAEQAYRAEIANGQTLLAEREMTRKAWANAGTSIRYADMYDRIQRNNALTKYTTAFDTAQRYVYMLAKVYDYETGLLSSNPLAGDSFMRDVIAARALGEAGVTTEQNSTLWDVVTRMSANWDVLKGRLGINNPETTTKWFSLRYSYFRIRPEADGDAAWRDALQACWRDDLWSDSEIARYCQPPQNDELPLSAEPGLVISFPTTINLAENFFGKPLLGGETTYSSSDYAVKLYGAGIRFMGYDKLAITTADGLASEPNVYLVPVGNDYMRSPSGTTRATLAFKVLDQVMPVPYDNSALSGYLGDQDWIATLTSGDGAATIRRHSTMAVLGGDEVTSKRLIGRSVWNDRWLLVIPASSLSSDRVNALKTFIHGLDTDKDGQVDVPGVSDIEIGIKAYSRSGN